MRDLSCWQGDDCLENWQYCRNVLIKALAKRFKLQSPCLDIGCGDGIEALKVFSEVFVIDIDPEKVNNALEKGLNAFQGDAESLPFEDAKFNAVLMLDVLEHIENDTKALDEVCRVLKPGGKLLVSVPLHPLLWSEHDIRLGHKRRYTVREIQNKLNNKFEIMFSTKWNCVSLPGAFLRKKVSYLVERDIPWIFKPVLYSESLLACRSFLPFGLSFFVVAQKKGGN